MFVFDSGGSRNERPSDSATGGEEPAGEYMSGAVGDIDGRGDVSGDACGGGVDEAARGDVGRPALRAAAPPRWLPGLPRVEWRGANDATSGAPGADDEDDEDDDDARCGADEASLVVCTVHGREVCTHQAA